MKKTYIVFALDIKMGYTSGEFRGSPALSLRVYSFSENKEMASWRINKLAGIDFINHLRMNRP